MSESKVDARLLGMRDLSSERGFVGGQREEVRYEAADSEEDQIRRAMRGGSGGGAESGVAAETMAWAGRLGAMGAKALDNCAGCSTATEAAAAEGCWWAVQQTGVAGVAGVCVGHRPHEASRCGWGCACMQDVVLSNSVRRQRTVTTRWHAFFIAAPLRKV
jgi:hypothetical protein